MRFSPNGAAGTCSVAKWIPFLPPRWGWSRHRFVSRGLRPWRLAVAPLGNAVKDFKWRFTGTRNLRKSQIPGISTDNASVRKESGS